MKTRIEAMMASGTPDHKFVVDVHHFKVIKQLTFEISNVRKDLLAQSGWSSEVGEVLWQLASSVPYELTLTKSVELMIFDGELRSFLERGSIDEAERGEAARNIVRCIPKSVADIWPHLLRTTFDFLGPLEARYRTGFCAEEISEALAALSGIVK